ncbi:MAG TPA: Ig-like domain-containing protein, partial [Thermoplasmata archaeon]|nr:Ig-like domain-containing protein [Thermoplasmata archaeon]
MAFSPAMFASASEPLPSPNVNPPAVWDRQVFYPPGQIAAKTGDYIQLTAMVKDNDTGIDPWWGNPAPVYLDMRRWLTTSVSCTVTTNCLRMYDDGMHLDGVANDSRYGSPPIRTTSPEVCAWEPIPLIASEAGAGPTIVTSITVAIDNLNPKFKKETWAIYPPGQTAYKEGDDAKFGVIASDRCVRAIDVVFDTDDSGSMVWNDPSDLRVDAICRFANTFMEPPDRGTGVFFYASGNSPDVFPRGALDNHLHDTYPRICSDAQTAQSSGGTDGWPAFRKSLDELMVYGDPNKIRMIIMLTDGEWNSGANNSANTILGPTGCQQQTIPVYTILLDPLPVNIALENQMKWIARQCGGQYFYAQNASVLDPIFQLIGKSIKRLPVPYGIDWMWLDGQPIGASRTIDMKDDGTHDDGEDQDEIYGTGPTRVTATTSGVFNVWAFARDIAHNVTSKNITFRMDNCAPDVTAVTVTPTRVKDGQTVKVGATVSDTPCNTVGGLEDVWTDARSIGGGDHIAMTCTGNTCTSPDIRVQTKGYIGDKRVNVMARDMAFNTASDEGLLDVDNAEPKVSPVGLVDSMVIKGEVTFQASAKDAVKVEIDITGPTPFKQFLEYSQESKLWRVTVDTLAFKDGDYTVAFTATDLYGDTDTSTGVKVRIDNSPPTIRFAKNVFDGAYVDGTQIIFDLGNPRSLLMPDDGFYTGSAMIQWRVNGGSWEFAQAPSPCPYPLCPVTTTWTTHLAGPGLTTDGPHLLEAKITDIAGREAWTAVTLIVDNHAPKVSVFSAPPLQFPTNGMARFGMDASDTGGLASVVYEYWNSANKWGPVNLLKGDDGYYWFDVDTRDIVANEFLWEGEFSYRVTATDLANGTPLHDPAAVTVKHVTVITSTPAPA